MNNYLEHHGIMGQKWGIRRYQNPDGSLTSEGKKRYYNSDGTLTKHGEKAAKKQTKDFENNWYKSYNKATNKFNSKIEDINNKYEDDVFDDEFSTKRGQEYIKEVDKMWRSLYIKELKNDYGNYELLGKDFIKNAPLMDNYSEFIRKEPKKDSDVKKRKRNIQKDMNKL